MRLRSDCGFTLLEVLVAVVVFGCLVVGLAQGVRFGLRAWNAEARAASAQGDLDALDNALRDMIAAMAPAGDPDPASLNGTSDTLAKVTELPMASGAADHHDAGRASRRPSAVLQAAGRRLDHTWHRHALAELVRIRVAFTSGSERHWPDSVVAPLPYRP
jgi:general secretion pathway protein J